MHYMQLFIRLSYFWWGVTDHMHLSFRAKSQTATLIKHVRTTSTYVRATEILTYCQLLLLRCWHE